MSSILSIFSSYGIQENVSFSSNLIVEDVGLQNLTGQMLGAVSYAWEPENIPQASWLACLITVLIVYISSSVITFKSDVKAPYGLRYLLLCPRFLANLLFSFDATRIIDKGYRKFKDRAFTLLRNDVNMVVLPASSVEEVSSLPLEVASGIGALEHDLLGRWTGLSMILESRLHHKVVQRRLTPNLSTIIPDLEDEVASAINDIFPSDATEWTTVVPYWTLLEVSARVSSRILVGFPVCRDPEWLDISINFTESIFESIVIMRFFPPWLYSTLGYLLPSVWRTTAFIRRAQKLLRPAFEKRLAELDDGSFQPTAKDRSGFTWLSELAEGKERSPMKLAHYEVLLALASIHTTLLREINVLYDCMADPNLLEQLRQEIADEAATGWNKASYGSLRKLDSVLRESQRMSPPTLIGLRRIMQKSHTLSDGTHLPKGSYICLPSYAIENDAANTEDPESFDGLRDYKKREAEGGSLNHQFSSFEPKVLGFGYGKTACPGRFFASLAIKAVFVKLFSEWEFKHMPGQEAKGKPQNMVAHEFMFPNRGSKILVRRRAGAKSPIQKANPSE